MKKYILGSFFLVVFALNAVFAQDIHFSQYNFTPLIVNPAQAGAYKAQEVIINYKSQWTSISPNGYKTMMLSYDGRMNQKKWKTKWLSVGVNLFSDRAGDGNMKTTQANVFLGYHTQISQKSTLGGGLIGGFSQRSIDVSKLTWDEQYVNGTYDPNAQSNETVGNSKFGYPDVGLGVLYQFAKGKLYSSTNDMVIIHTGIAATHLNQPKYSFYGTSAGEKLYPKITGHIDAVIGIKNTNVSLLPGFIYTSQGPSSEALPGCYFRYLLRQQSKFTGFVKGASMMVGTHLRVKDAFIPSIQFEFAEYMIGISYDVNVSGLRTVTSNKGGFEISLRWGNPNPFLYKSAASFQ